MPEMNDILLSSTMTAKADPTAPQPGFEHDRYEWTPLNQYRTVHGRWTVGKSNKFLSASSMSREVPDRLPRP